MKASKAYRLGSDTAIKVLVGVALLLILLLAVSACTLATANDTPKTNTGTESLSDTTLPSTAEKAQSSSSLEASSKGAELFDLEAYIAKSEDEPTTIEEMPDRNPDDPNNQDTYDLWLIALDREDFYENIVTFSNGTLDEAYIDICISNMPLLGTNAEDSPELIEEKTEVMLKASVLMQQMSDQGRDPTSIEAQYITYMQMLVFGEASSVWAEYYQETSYSAQSEDSLSVLSGGGSANFDGPSVGTYPLGSQDAPFQKGLILITNDPAGSLPTGHAAILYDVGENTAMTSFPLFASRNTPQEAGVQTEPNDWNTYHATCFVLESNVTTTAESAAVADWCYDPARNSKPFSISFFFPWRTDQFYCSQLVWMGFIDVCGVDIGNADATFSDWGNAVHPMELKRADETTLLYQHGTVDTGWVDINNTDRYYVDSTGQESIGWHTIDGHWYYFDSLGVMQTGWQIIEGDWYYLEDDGVMKTGWQQIEGSWYYLNSDGVMQTGWQIIGGDTYYFGSDGAMCTGLRIIEGNTYYFGADGALNSGGSSGVYLSPYSTIYPINDNLTAIVGQPLFVGGTPNSGSPANFYYDFILDPAYSSLNPIYGVDWEIAYVLNPASDSGIATVNKYTGLLTPTAAGTVIVDCYLINGSIVQDQSVPPTNAIGYPVSITVYIEDSGGLYGAQGNSQNIFMNTINGETFTNLLAILNGDSTYGYQNTLMPLTPANNNLAFNFTMAAGTGPDFANFVACNDGNIQLFTADASGEPIDEIAVLEADNEGILFFDVPPNQSYVSHTVTLNVNTEVLEPGSYVLRFIPYFKGNNVIRTLDVNVDFIFSI